MKAPTGVPSGRHITSDGMKHVDVPAYAGSEIHRFQYKVPELGDLRRFELRPLSVVDAYDPVGWRYAEWAGEPATAHSARSRGARQPRCLWGAQVHGGAAARTVGLLNARAERARQPLQILCLRDREVGA